MSNAEASTGSPSATSAAPTLPDGLVAVVKKDCETCVLVDPILGQLAEAGALTVFSQDDTGFPTSVCPIDDTELAVSYHHEIETVPTLLRIENGAEVDRTVGWMRDEWETFTGVSGLGPGLPDFRPGCGSLSVDPDRAAQLAVRYGGSAMRSQRVEIAALEDEMEAMFDRGWSDGLPVVPPTPERVMRMLEGTTRAPDEVVTIAPPDLVECTVEKIAINAVMAGCRPEYLPVVITAVEALCTESFNGHGLLCTTYSAGPVVIVNGPIARAIGMNSGHNCLGQGNRANLTIGRAVQLVIRNVGGGRPGEVDRGMQGNPGKLSFCYAEDEAGSPWESLAVERGVAPDTSAVTLFAGAGSRIVVDQLSREPESLCGSLAGGLRAVANHKLIMGMDALLVIGPEHARVFADAGWSKAQVIDKLTELLTGPADDILRGADGIAEGIPEQFAGATVPKFRPGGILITHAGGGAGMFSTIIDGWVSGTMGSDPITMAVGT